MIRAIVIRCGVLILILLGLNWIYTVTLFESDLNEKSDKIVEVREKQKETDIFYFAESSNVSVRDDDSTQRSISEITNWFFPNLRITAINNAASHAGIFKYWLKEINPKLNKPKAVIVTMNMRSFDAAWIHSKLETPLRESVVFTQPYPNLINRFLLALQAFDNKTDQQREMDVLKDWEKHKLIFPFKFRYKTVNEWNYSMANGGHLRADGTWDVPKSTLACHYIKAYAFNLDESNPRIKDFDEIAEWCAQHELKLYFNLMAENVHYADSLVGKELVFLMKQNRDYLVKRYNSANCKVIDNLEKVEGLEFTDQEWTTEHYGYRGRMIIAKNLAESMRNQFKNEYIKAY